MKSVNKINFLTVLFLTVFCVSLSAQTTYYVSSSSGSDSYTGISESRPFETIEKVNSLNLTPGDKVLFKSGDIWEEQKTLTISNSGTENARITIGAYGTGNSPILSLSSNLYPNDSKKTGNWEYEGNNVWSIQAYGSTNRVFLDGKEYNSTTSTSNINNTFRWYYSTSRNRLYVYATSNPATFYSSIKRTFYSQQYSVIELVSADNITISNLDLRYGLYGVKARGTDNLIIEDSNIGYRCDRIAIDVRGDGSDISSKGIIRNNVINSGFSEIEFYEVYTMTGSNGIDLEEGVTYFEIYDNEIRDWYHNNIQILGWDTENRISSYHKVYNNLMISSGISYSRGFTVGGIEETASQFNEIFSNRIIDTVVPNEVGGNDNSIYYNIIDNVREQYIITKDGYVNTQTGIAFTLEDLFGTGLGVCKNNKIYNNVIKDVKRRAATVYGFSNQIVNNLFINTPLIALIANSNRNSVYSNNYYYNENNSSSDFIISYDKAGYTADKFNNADDSNNSDIINNNVRIATGEQFVVDLENSNFTPSAKSILINAGIEMGTTKDFNLNVITDLPDVGAFESGYENNDIDDNSKDEEIPVPAEETIQLKVKDVTASSTSNTGTSPLFTIDGKGANDGNTSSRWSTYPTPAWICYDLGETKTISKTRFSFYYYDNGRVYQYSILVSEDNENWTKVIDNVSSSTNEYTENEFAPISGRYVKVDLHGSNNSKWATIWEGEIYGSEGTVPEIITPLTNWESTIEVKDSKNSRTIALTFGQNDQATNSIDLDEEILPPSAPDMFELDARLTLVDGYSQSTKDIKVLEDKTTVWNISLQGTAPYTLTWDSAKLADREFLLQDKFGGQLVNIDMIENSSYTLNFQLSELVIIMGTVQTNEITLSKGWNKISEITSVSVQSVATEPAGIIESPFYINNGKFETTDTLEIGKEYWVKTSKEGKLLLNKKSHQEEINVIEQKVENSWGRIVVTDNNGLSTTLYVTDNDHLGNEFSLPPVPEKGLFDVRFTNNMLAKELSNIDTDLSITHANYPLTIKVEGIDLLIKDKIDGSYIDAKITSGEEIVINDEFVNMFEIETEIVPSNFNLDQNYPNPFNPTTTIAFSIPIDSKVALNVYNILGEKVAGLMNEQLSAGSHKVNFNATNLSSGIYLYVLESADFTSVKKMTLLK
ncbi:MAG: discoidin domain-containing protein [Melioribacteraceae bacterium]|nr:discoidin domain-containing protein [Melioribacteraceae bacterium]